MKKNSGITLIALVITIIVLLILAGVAIAMISGNGGILGKASDAKVQNAMGEMKDTINLAVTSAIADYYEEAYVSNNATTQNQDIDIFIVNELGGTGTGAASFDTKYSKAGVFTTTIAEATDSADTNTSTQTIYNITITPEDTTLKGYTGVISGGKVTWTKVTE